MKTRPIGDLQAGAIGLGAAGLSVGPHPPEDDAIATIVAALDAGVTLIDTAACYVPRHDSPGHNEALIAKALATWGGDTDDVVVITKGGVERIATGGTLETDFRESGHPDDIRRQCETSLRALGVDTIDVYQLHNATTDVPLAETMGAFAALQQEGKIRHIGLSNASVAQVELARTIVEVVSVQNSFSPANRESADVVTYCEREGLAFLAYSPLGGLGDRARTMPDTVPALREIAQQRETSPHRIALAWELAWSPVMIPIPGARRPETIRDSAAAADVELSPEEMERLGRP